MRLHKRESSIQNSILRAWGAHPRLRITRINTGAAMLHGRMVRFNPKGTGDIVGLIAPSGQMLMIECKSAIGKQSHAQKVMQRVVEKFGGMYVLARCVEDVDAAMAAIGITR